MENYLILREKAFICLNKAQRQEAEKYLLDAYLLYPLDLILLKLLGDFYLVRCDNIHATRYFREALDIKNNDLYSLAKFGHLLTISKQYSKAIPYLEKAILKNNKLKLILIILSIILLLIIKPTRKNINAMARFIHGPAKYI